MSLLMEEGLKYLKELTYYYAGKSALKCFVRFKSPLIIYNDIKNGRVFCRKKTKFNMNLGLNEILKGNSNYKSEDQISAIKNI